MNTTKTYSLQEYIEHLMTGPHLPPPGEPVSPADILQRTQTEGRIVEVSQGVYWWFLEVLPPHWMDGHRFCFAEGAEPFLLFWQQERRYFCRQLTLDETHAFCDLADIPRDF